MRTFDINLYAKKLKEKYPYENLTVELVDSDGSLCIYVRDENESAVGFFDTGLSGDEYSEEAEKLVKDLGTALKYPEYYEYTVIDPDNNTLIAKSKNSGKFALLKRDRTGDPWTVASISDSEDELLAFSLYHQPVEVKDRGKLVAIRAMRFLREVR